MSRPTLNDLTAFTTVARYRSFRKAADELGVSRSALSHAMRGLEQNLGIRLLNRTTRSVAPTEAGGRLLARLGPAMQGLDAALDVVADTSGKPHGTLRINANKSAAQRLLVDVVPSFLTKHPSVELDLVVDGQLVDIVEQGYDAGVRLWNAVPRDMIAIRLGGDLRFVTVASPGYIEKNGTPVTPDDLRHHNCIRQRLPSGKRYRWEFGKHGEEITIDVPGVLTLDDSDLMVKAAATGLGLCYVPDTFAKQMLNTGQLVAVLEDWSPWIPGLALYYPGHSHVPSPLRAFIDEVKRHRPNPVQPRFE